MPVVLRPSICGPVTATPGNQYTSTLQRRESRKRERKKKKQKNSTTRPKNRKDLSACRERRLAPWTNGSLSGQAGAAVPARRQAAFFPKGSLSSRAACGGLSTDTGPVRAPARSRKPWVGGPKSQLSSCPGCGPVRAQAVGGFHQRARTRIQQWGGENSVSFGCPLI